MKRLLHQLVMPLTIISFVCITKCWDVQVVDGTRELMKGFPFIYTCRCFYTSMCHQFFATTFIADLIVYLLFWCVVVFGTNRYIIPISTPKTVTRLLTATAAVAFLYFAFLMVAIDSSFKLSRDFEVEVIDTQYGFYLL